MEVIREHLGIRRYDATAELMVTRVVHETAQTKEDLADILNVMIEELVRQRYELPGFTVLLRMHATAVPASIAASIRG